MSKKILVFFVLISVTFFGINYFLFPARSTDDTTSLAPPKMQETSLHPDETLYVIENGYQQLVISSLNGAVAELNLRLQGPQAPLSIVRPVEIDRRLAKDYPQTDYFPARPYESKSGRFQTGVLGGYYPLLRRNVPPTSYGLTLQSLEGKETSTPYRLVRLENREIELEGTVDGIRVNKVYTLPDDACVAPYSFQLTLRSDAPIDEFGLSTGIIEAELVSGQPAPSLKYCITENGSRKKTKLLSLPKQMSTISGVRPVWIANTNSFFAILLNPTSPTGDYFTTSRIDGNEAVSRLTVIDSGENKYPPAQFPGYQATLPLGKKIKESTFRIFAGPLDSTVLKKNDQAYHADYSGLLEIHGWFAFISEPFARFLFFLMKIFHSAVHSWGISIILLTVTLRAMMYPLNAWSIRSMIKMQRLAPKLTALQERNKHDPKRAQMEMMQLYKEHGVNPLSGCFPLLIQMPFLIGMFDLLKTAFELRGVSFIPGWITNLTSPDVIFSWGTPIWFLGSSFHLLPLLLGATMFWQQRMSSTLPKKGAPLTDQQRQQKIMGNLMVIVFTVLFYNFPSGLNLYWLSSMLLAILQQWWMTRKG